MKRIILTVISVIIALGASAQTPKGHLVIIGGGKNTSDIMDAFIEYAGGPQSKFLVISTAGHRKGGKVTTQEDGERFISQLAKKGAMNASWADPTRKENDDPVYVAKLLDGVTGVFFTGGYQSSIIKEMRGTKMHEALMKKYEKDGIVIGGTSAGAGMMTDPMIAGSKLKTDEKGVKEESVTSIEPGRASISPGMGFLKNAIIDQHVIVRSRENRMFSAAMDMPQVTTFGIDESTAMVVSNGNEVEVVGESSVMVLEVGKNSGIKKNKNGNYGCADMTVRLLVNGDKYIIEPKENAAPAEDILFTQGAGMVNYVCPVPFKGDNIEIFYYIPKGDQSKMPVQIVMHGMGRNADGYRDKWIPWADKYGCAVIVPHYPEDPYTEEVYQQGNVKNLDGTFNKKSELIYDAVDYIFDFVIAHSALEAKTYNIYGHSAGAQFVHRYLLFNKTSRCEKAVSANSGWYTFPDENIAYPYGLKDCVKRFDLDKAAYYAKDVTILLGDADTLRTSNLRQTPESDLQGLTRLARGQKFYNDCKADAEKMGVPFNWKIDYVPHVGHSNGKMAGPAADIIYGK